MISKKILFVANNLKSGGMQTALINLLRYLSKNENYNIDLFLFSTNSEKIKDIPQNVNIIKGNYFLDLTAHSFKEIINSKNIINIFVRLLLIVLARIIKPDKLYKLLFNISKNMKEYDIAVSYFNDSTNTYFNRGATDYVLNHCKAKKKIGWIHNDIEKAGWDIEYYKKKYCQFDYIVNVSNYCKEVYDRLIPEQKEKSLVVYNIFPIQYIREKANDKQNEIIENNEKINIITVARLVLKQKRIDRIIEVSKKLIDNNIENFRWFVIGDGEDYNIIKKLIVDYELTNKVILLGDKKNPYPYIKASDLFVLTSDYERLSYGSRGKYYFRYTSVNNKL